MPDHPTETSKALAAYIADAVRRGSLCLCGKSVCEGESELATLIDRHLHQAADRMRTKAFGELQRRHGLLGIPNASDLERYRDWKDAADWFDPFAQTSL
jgi:hypothetical protein